MRKSVSSRTEFSGAALLSILQNLNSQEIEPFARKYDLEQIDPDGWYPLQNFLNFLNELTQHPNLVPNMVALGLGISELALMPLQLENSTFEEVVKGWDLHYQANFRNGDVGRKTTIQVGRRHYKIIHDRTVIPDDVEYGVLYGFARQFLPQGTYFKVWYDEDVLRMDHGGDQTVLHVAWD